MSDKFRTHVRSEKSPVLNLATQSKAYPVTSDENPFRRTRQIAYVG